MREKTKYFELSISESSGGVAFVPEEYLYDYYEKIKEVNKIPFSLKIERGYFEDFLSNDLGWPLMSLGLKNLFDKYKASACKFKWVSVWVESVQQSSMREYYYLVCLEKPEVLDLRRTKIINGDYLNGVFSYEKIKEYSFFPHASEHNNGLIVFELLKNDIIASGMSGVDFELAEVV